MGSTLHQLKSHLSMQSKIVVVTALTNAEIAAKGGLPAGMPVYPKPIPFAALHILIKHFSQKLAQG